MNNHLQPLTPAALYARVSSDRQDIGPVPRRTAKGAPGLRRDERLGSDYGQKWWAKVGGSQYQVRDVDENYVSLSDLAQALQPVPVCLPNIRVSDESESALVAYEVSNAVWAWIPEDLVSVVEVSNRLPSA